MDVLRIRRMWSFKLNYLIPLEADDKPYIGVGLLMVCLSGQSINLLYKLNSQCALCINRVLNNLNGQIHE